MIEAAIIGAAGYTAGELIRILVNHPEVRLGSLVSQSQSGKPVSDIHQDLIAYNTPVFSKTPGGNPDVIFLCMGHGKSRDWVANYSGNAKIIDLSQDFRHGKTADGFIYGLPEFQRDKIRTASRIANPGCFATAIQLALLPAAAAGLLQDEVHVHGTTGSTGAGQSLSDTSHFSWRNNNVSLYKVFDHQHLIEIGETLASLQKTAPTVNFLPMRGNFTRGIFVSAYTAFNGDAASARKIYEDFYAGTPFTKLTDSPLHLKQVVNTNMCLVNITVKDGKLLVTSIIDNLVKGASGQAIQNMNLAFGFGETTGLLLKASYF